MRLFLAFARVFKWVDRFTGDARGPVFDVASPWSQRIHPSSQLFLYNVQLDYDGGIGTSGLFTGTDVVISTLGVVCVFIGVKFGSAIRERLSEKAFRNVILAILTMMSISLLMSSFVAPS